nr:hypothetical protein [Tanacetum cinerariifolium]
VKGIGLVSPMKSKVTGKSDSPRRKPVVVKEKSGGVTSKISKGNDDVVKAPVVADEVPVVADKALVVKATVADKAPVVKATVADIVVADKEPIKEISAGNVGKAPVKDKVKVFVLEGSLALIKDNVKAPVKDNVEVSVLKGNLLVDVVPNDMVLNKAMDESSWIGVSGVSFLALEIGMSKKEDSDSELETDDVDSSPDEVDRKLKKLKIKPGLKRKRSGSDCSSIDTENIKRLISKLEKKVKKQESDEESVPKKGKKKLTKKFKKEESDEESVPKKGKKKEKKLTPE